MECSFCELCRFLTAAPAAEPVTGKAGQACAHKHQAYRFRCLDHELLVRIQHCRLVTAEGVDVSEDINVRVIEVLVIVDCLRYPAIVGSVLIPRAGEIPDGRLNGLLSGQRHRLTKITGIEVQVCHLLVRHEAGLAETGVAKIACDQVGNIYVPSRVRIRLVRRIDTIDVDPGGALGDLGVAGANHLAVVRADVDLATGIYVPIYAR